MDYNSNLVRFLFVLGITLEILITVVLVRRRLLTKVPAFSAYIIGLVVMDPTLLLIYNSGHEFAYFYSRWAQEGICVALSFMVILEVFQKTLNEYESIRRFSIRFLIVACLLLTTASILILPYGTRPDLFMDTFTHTVTAAERSLRILQIGVVVAFLALSSYLALSWKHYLFGIIFGYGLYATVNLSRDAYCIYMGPPASYITGLIESVAYLCTLLIWLIYLMKPDPPHRGLPSSGIATDDLERWSDALTKLR
jgi:hypothetical protein